MAKKIKNLQFFLDFFKSFGPNRTYHSLFDASCKCFQGKKISDWPLVDSSNWKRGQKCPLLTIFFSWENFTHYGNEHILSSWKFWNFKKKKWCASGARVNLPHIGKNALNLFYNDFLTILWYPSEFAVLFRKFLPKMPSDLF
jgi:hypothetical protein